MTLINELDQVGVKFHDYFRISQEHLLFLVMRAIFHKIFDFMTAEFVSGLLTVECRYDNLPTIIFSGIAVFTRNPRALRSKKAIISSDDVSRRAASRKLPP